MQNDSGAGREFAAARAMSCGETACHDGPIKEHSNGWGCLWLENGEIQTLRGSGPFAEALPGIDVERIKGRFLAVHVRNAKLSKNQGLEFSHLLLRDSAGTRWYMMHNGFMLKVYARLGMAASRFDSAEYLVDPITPADFTRDYLRQKLAQVEPGGQRRQRGFRHPRSRLGVAVAFTGRPLSTLFYAASFAAGTLHLYLV